MMDNLEYLLSENKHKEDNTISQALQMNKTEYKAEIEYNKAVVPKKSNIEDKSSSLLQKSEGIDMLDGSSEHSSSQNSLRNDVHITCGELAEQTLVPMITVNN